MLTYEHYRVQCALTQLRFLDITKSGKINSNNSPYGFKLVMISLQYKKPYSVLTSLGHEQPFLEKSAALEDDTYIAGYSERIQS